MAGRIEELRERAKKNPKTIVLPEGNEVRVLEAADAIISQGIADIILVGSEEEINKKAKEASVSLKKIRVIDPKRHDKKDAMVETFYNLRKHKGVTVDEARKTVLGDTVFFGALLVREGTADGFVAGASHTTSDVARAALYCIGLEEGIQCMSSSFLIEIENCPYGDDGLFVFADCGIVPNPTAEQLTDITVSTSELYERLYGRKGKVALLSYSTKGSAKGDSVNKVLSALEMIRKRAPDLRVDGELQLDAAIVPDVACIKAPQSAVAGKADVLIFPNLDAGNISYKLTQRLGNARVVGPLIQGLKRPCSDLSRGCFVDEIIDAVAVTVLRTQRC